MNRPAGHILALLLALLAAVISTSCHTQKEASSSAPAAGQETVSPFMALTASCQPGWEAVRVPFSLRLTSPKEMTVGGIATMSRDSSILLSFRMLGFEVAALQVNGDTLTVIEKMNKQYLTVPVANALGGLDACVANIQDILTGRIFLLGTPAVTADMESRFSLKSTDDGRAWILAPKKQPHGARYSFSLTPSGRLEALTVVPDGFQEATAAYSSAADTPAGSMATAIDISAELKGKPLRATIEWDWRKARFDSDVEIKPLSVGRGYRQLDISSLLKKLPAQNINK